MDFNNKTYSYQGITVVVRRSKVKDALRRDTIRRALELLHPDLEERGYIGAFARAVTQSVSATGLPFDPTSVTPGNADEAYQQAMEFDEEMLTGWFNTAIEVNEPIDPALAPGVETDSLKKKKTESEG